MSDTAGFKDVDYLLEERPDKIIEDTIDDNASLFTGDKAQYLTILKKVVGSLYEEQIQRLEVEKNKRFPHAIPQTVQEAYTKHQNQLRGKQRSMVTMIDSEPTEYLEKLVNRLEFIHKTEAGKR